MLLSNFNRVAGISETVGSRVQSLRRIVWDDGNDSFTQSLGYTGDLFMNTGYLCYLYIFNMFILYNVSDPFEILGSVIFFEFLFDLDEEIASTSWWDGRKRFFRAGVVEVMMQTVIRREYTATRDTYTAKLGALLSRQERMEVIKRLDEAGIPDNSAFISGEEGDMDIGLLTIGEWVERMRELESRASVQGDFTDGSKPKAYFGISFGLDAAMFERHVDLRAWSQWEKLLFIYPIPTLVRPNYVPGTKIVLEDETGDLTTMLGDKGFQLPGKSKRERFILHVRDVLSCRYMRRNFNTAFEYNSRWYRFTRGVHAVFAWQSYAIQVAFPFITLLAVVLVYSDYYCVLHLGECDVGSSESEPV